MSKTNFKINLEKTNRKIMHLAESENWDELLTLSKQRDEFIRGYFDDKSLQHTKQSANDLLQSVKHSDQLVADKLEVLKQRMISNSLNLKNSQSAINSYKKTQET
jgi:hypothetical protein